MYALFVGTGVLDGPPLPHGDGSFDSLSLAQDDMTLLLAIRPAVRSSNGAAGTCPRPTAPRRGVGGQRRPPLLDGGQTGRLGRRPLRFLWMVPFIRPRNYRTGAAGTCPRPTARRRGVGGRTVGDAGPYKGALSKDARIYQKFSDCVMQSEKNQRWKGFLRILRVFHRCTSVETSRMPAASSPATWTVLEP